MMKYFDRESSMKSERKRKKERKKNLRVIIQVREKAGSCSEKQNYFFSQTSHFGLHSSTRFSEKQTAGDSGHSRGDAIEFH